MPSSLNGTGLTFSSGATLNSPPVTSVATGNGLSGGTITTTGTLAVACPGFNTVGAYVIGSTGGNTSVASGGTISAGSGSNQLQSESAGICGNQLTNNLSGTWRNMAGPYNYGGSIQLWCRVS